MHHDTLKTGCDRRAGSIVHVMTPSFEADTVQVSWSNCSRRYITHFLELVIISILMLKHHFIAIIYFSSFRFKVKALVNAWMILQVKWKCLLIRNCQQEQCIMLIFNVVFNSTWPMKVSEFVQKWTKYARNYGVLLMMNASHSCVQLRLELIAGNIRWILHIKNFGNSFEYFIWMSLFTVVSKSKVCSDWRSTGSHR